LIFTTSPTFYEPEDSSSGRRLYVQVWYGMVWYGILVICLHASGISTVQKA